MIFADISSSKQNDMQYLDLNRQGSVSQTRISAASLMGSKNTSKRAKHAYNLHLNVALDVNHRFLSYAFSLLPLTIVAVVVVQMKR